MDEFPVKGVYSPGLNSHCSMRRRNQANMREVAHAARIRESERASFFNVSWRALWKSARFALNDAT
jgi:hypothetical protein